MERHDVVVVGAGFAGLAAARELSHRAIDVLVLEARDRIGGRAWTGPFADVEVELGGAFVHWYQAHVWAELTRYGIGVEPALEPERAIWIAEGRRFDGEPDALWERLADGMRGLNRGAEEVFPLPVDPLAGGRALLEADRLSVRDRLDELGLPAAVGDPVSGLSSTLSSAPSAEAGLTQLLRAFALAAYDARLVGDINGTYGIAGGTRALAEALAADGGHEIRTSSAVVSVTHDDRGARVELEGGGTVDAGCLVVAVPINALRTVRFEPPLPADKAGVVAAGQASRGAKVWIRTEDALPPTIALGPEDRMLPFLETVPSPAGGGLVVGFSATNDAFRPERRDRVVEELREVFPGIGAGAVGGHDWTADPWSRGTWCCFRPGQLTDSLRALQRPEGRVTFAGGDIAEAWGGYIDGAIESGLRAARDVVAALAA
jgi:monoamine oxidase